MIQQIVTVLNASLATTGKFAVAYCLAELRTDGNGRRVPYAYTAAGSFVPVDLDSGSAAYWRLPLSATFEDITPKYSAARMVEGTYYVRLVLIAHRGDAFDPTRLSNDIAALLIAQDGDIGTAVSADSVTISATDIDHDTPSIFADEFSGIVVEDLPYHLFMVAMNIKVTIVAPASCWAVECNLDPDILHWFNFCDNATFERLTPQQLECLTERICDTPPTLCEQLAEVAPDAVVAEVFECLTAEAQAELLASECVIPPCADASWTLLDENGGLLNSGTIASGGSQPITAPNGDYTLTDTLGNVLATGDILSGGSIPIVAPNGTFELRAVGGVLLATGSILSGQLLVQITAPNASYTLKKTGGATISSGSIASGASQDITAPDASAVLKDSAGTTISTTAIQSNTSANITAPDGSVTINGTAMTPVKSNGSNAYQVLQGGSPVGSGSGLTWTVPACPTAASLAVAASSSTPAYGASVTITGTPTGITPTLYTFRYPSDSAGGYASTTQAGAALAITARGYGAQVVTVTATNGVTTVGGTVTLTVPEYTPIQTLFTNAPITDATQKSAYRTYALGLLDLSLYSLFYDLMFFIGGTASTHKYNAIDARDLDAAYRMVFAGGITHSATGALFNGTNAYGNSKLPNNTPAQNNVCIMIYVRTSGASGYDVSAGLTPRTTLAVNSGGNTTFDINNSVGAGSFTAPSSQLGLWSLQRISATQMEIYYNGKCLRVVDVASAVPAVTEFFLASLSGGAALFAAREYCFFSVSQKLTALQHAQHYALLQAAETSLSRQV